MNITVIGTGYVGLVVGTCFSEMGNDVYCIDTDPERISSLKKGIIPIYEPGLDILVSKNHSQGRLHFSENLVDGFEKAEFVFIAVGTPPQEDGSADLSYVLGVGREIGRLISDYKIIINKSTVPVGTADKVREVITEELAKRNLQVPFDVVSNPEFLKEGDAVSDFMSPDRVIIGSGSEKATEMMIELYSVFFRKNPRVITMDVRSAEVTKYASNAMLATKISFMNEMANLCEAVGADVEKVRLGIGADKRIGYSFIYPGIGYGGSCFPKDVKAIVRTGEEYGCKMDVLKAVEEVNARQKAVIPAKIKSVFPDLKGKTFTIWGLSFKPETDDMREAPSLVIIKSLVEAGARVHAHDPIAAKEAQKVLADYKEQITYFEDNYQALKDSSGLILCTEWHMYRQPDFGYIERLMTEKNVFDGRNLYDPQELATLGFEYFGIGR